MSLSKINLGIIGKPNSGKSTLFNTLLGERASPVGDEYGLTKSLFISDFVHKNYNFAIVDTPGLRRKSRVVKKIELEQNYEVIKVIKKVETIVLLIDSLENVTKQDFRLADLAINKNKILFFFLIRLISLKIKKNFRRKSKNCSRIIIASIN